MLGLEGPSLLFSARGEKPEGPKPKAQGADSGSGVLGDREGQLSPPHQL